MRLAWFAPTPLDTAAPADDTALLVRALRARHAVDVIDPRRAHDFVPRHDREPYDLCVFELGGAAADPGIAAYAVHYPGIVLLRGVPRHDRALRAARLVVVPHEPVARALADDHPDVRVRTLVPGVEPLADNAPAVVDALRWPPDAAALTQAIAGFAAGRAVIVFDGPETADWPSLDPQSWEMRDPLWRHRPGQHGPDPICVSVDPRDEAHSAHLARRRLQADAGLRARLGAAAQAWWRTHATVPIAAERFETLMAEARAVTAPAPPWADEAGGRARAILRDFKTTVEPAAYRDLEAWGLT